MHVDDRWDPSYLLHIKLGVGDHYVCYMEAPCKQCLYPSTGLQNLIGACVRFETHVEIGTLAHKSNEGLYTVQGSNQSRVNPRRGHARRTQIGLHTAPVGRQTTREQRIQQRWT